MTPEDYPKLLELARNTDKTRAELAQNATWEAGKIWMNPDFAVLVLSDPECSQLHSDALRSLADKASKDVTPMLLATCKSESPALQEEALRTLRAIWFPEFKRKQRPPSQASQKQLQEWEAGLRSTVLTLLEDEETDWRVSGEAIALAKCMGLEEIVPIVTETCLSRRVWGFGGQESDAVDALCHFGTDEAVETLRDLAICGDVVMKMEILESLEENPHASKAVSWVSSLLYDASNTGMMPFEVRHLVANVLAGVYPDGPGRTDSEATEWKRDAMDAVVEKWKVYMAEKLAEAK